MGRTQTGNRKYQLKQMNETHREIARRVFLGERSIDIAQDLGISTETVSYTRNSTLVQEYISDLQRAKDAATVDVAERLAELAPLALAVVHEGLQGELGSCANDHIKMRAATEILDRAGYNKINKVDARVAHSYLTGEDIERIRREVEIKQLPNHDGKDYVE